MMRIRRIIALAVTTLSAVLMAEAQNVTFVSPGFETGVKMHLQLADDAAVPQSRTDTITAIDLSGLEISDVSDIQWLPNVRSLNLRMNAITDISPLADLDSLHYLDLSYNHLEDIDMLIFTNSDQMYVNVAGNHIKDFSLFFNPSICCFEMVGMGVQTEKDAPYMQICHFFADVDDESKPVITLRGYTNVENDCTLACEGVNMKAPLDGLLNSIAVAEDFEHTVSAVVTNGEQGDTTWVVPQKVFDIRANQEVTFDTELPETYTIEYAIANEGTVTVEGSTLRYQAPAAERNDTVYFTYYDGSRLKGFSRFYLSNQEATAISGITSADVSVSLRQHLLVVDMSSVRPGEPIAIQVVDAKGRQIVSHQSAAETTRFHQELQLPLVRDEIVIVQVKTSDRKIIKKLSVRN